MSIVWISQAIESRNVYQYLTLFPEIYLIALVPTTEAPPEYFHVAYREHQIQWHIYRVPGDRLLGHGETKLIGVVWELHHVTAEIDRDIASLAGTSRP